MAEIDGLSMRHYLSFQTALNANLVGETILHICQRYRLNQCSSRQWRVEFFKSSWMASCPERIRVSTWLVGAFPHLNHTTFGGEPYSRLLSAKSASWVTIQKSFNLAKSQISVSVFSASSWNCTWLALGKISAKQVTNFRLRFWSNSSFKRHSPKQINDDRDQPQTLDRL